MFGVDGYFTNPNGYEFREKNFQSKNPKINKLSELFQKQRKQSSDNLSGAVYFRVILHSEPP